MDKKVQGRFVFFLLLVSIPTLYGFLFLCYSAQGAESTQIPDRKGVYDSEKKQAMSVQLDRIGTLLEKERFISQGNEAETFVRELTEDPPRQIELRANAPMEIRSTARQAPPPSVQKKQKKGWNIFSYKREKTVSEGEVLYQVAISDGKVTLSEAVKIALANNLAAAAAKKKIEVARAKLTEARRALFPTVQLAYEEIRGKVSGTVDDGLGGTNANKPRYFEGKSKKINVTQPLFRGGELLHTVHQAEENLKLSQEEYKKLRNEAIQQVRTAYFGAVKQEYNLQYQLTLLNEVSDFHKKVREAYSSKFVSEIDYLNVDSQRNQVYFQFESAKNDLLSANLLLRQNLNMASEEYLPVHLKISYVKLEPDFDELFKIALQNNPELRMKEYAFQSAFYGVKIYEAKKLPKIDLKGSYGMLGEQFHDTRALRLNEAENDLGKEWSVIVEASMPLGPNSIEYTHRKNKYGPTVIALTGSEDWRRKYAFNFYDKLSDITDEKSAAAAYLQAQSDLQTARNTLISQLREGYYDLKKAVIQMDSAISKIRYQSKQTAAARYLVGLQETPGASYVESLIELTSHKFSLIQAAVDYHLAISTLNLQIGDPYYFETES